MPSFYPENNTPFANDSETKILNKILDSLNVIPVKGQTAGGTVTPFLLNNDGSLNCGLSFSGNITVGTVQIDQATPHANEVVVKTAPLPTGAATEATLVSVLGKLITAPATSGKQDIGNSSLSSVDGKIVACNTGAVAVTSSVLPTGAATQATMANLEAKAATEATLASILAKLIAGPATEATLAALNAKITAMNSGATVIQSGAITNTPVAPSRVNSSAYEAARVVKASAGRLFNISGYNSGPAQFLQIHDAASLPAESEVPCAIFAIPSLASFSYEFELGIPCSTGIVVTNSSTGPTKTIGSANCFFTATYI